MIRWWMARRCERDRLDQERVLRVLREEGPGFASEIWSALGIHAGRVAHALAQLEQAGRVIAVWCQVEGRPARRMYRVVELSSPNPPRDEERT